MDTQPSRPNPYVGPRAYQTGEILYGRDQDILNLYYLLLAERVVLLFSPSGAGKSSLIQAGLIPRLREKFRFIPVIRVNHEPPGDLSGSDGFNRYIYSALLSLEESAPAEARLPAAQLAGMSLPEYLERRPLPAAAGPARPVFEALIFDQFEEILTTAPNDYAGKQVFFDQVGEALHDTRRWALFSARQDYAAAFEPYLRAIPTRFANRYRLELLDTGGALDAIQKPAAQAGALFSDAAAQKLVDDLRSVQTQQPDGSSAQEFGPFVEPVQLQVVCYRIWNNLSAGETTISEEKVASTGSVNESLSAYYAEQVAAAEKEFNVPQRIIREWFNNQLITRQGIRSQVILEPEQSGGLDNRVIRFMQTAHLVRAEKRTGSTWFELAHDRLIEPIRADNEQWLRANLSLLQQQAELWERQDRPDSLLLRESALAQARLWAAAHEKELLPFELDFLAACKQQEARALRLKRRNQVISILGIVSMLLAVIAWLAYRQANIQRLEAQRQERAAHEALLAAQARAALDEFPQRSLLLALEALKLTARAGETRQATAEEALRDALARPRGQPLGRQAGAISALAYTPDGRRLAGASLDGTFSIWDMQSANPGAAPVTLDAQGTEIRAAAVSPDGRWLAGGGSNTSAFLWRLDDLTAAPLMLAGHAANITALAFSPDGRWLATGSVDENILLWDLNSSNPARDPRRLTGHRGDISALAFDPRGRWLASGSLDKTARLWDLADPALGFVPLEGHTQNVNLLAFSPDGRWLATGSVDKTARLWDLQASKPVAKSILLAGHEDRLLSLDFSPDNRWLATGSADHSARLWNLTSDDPSANPLVLRGHTDTVNILRFSPDNRWLATGSGDHTVRLWNLSAPDPAASPGVLRGHDAAVYALAFSPDGSRLASGGGDGSTRLWVMRPDFPAENVQILHGHSDEVRLLAFSPDGRWLSTAGLDGTVNLWDMRPANPPAGPLALPGNSAYVGALAYSSSGARLAAGGGDRIIRLWDVTASNPPAPLELTGSTAPLTALVFGAGNSTAGDDRWLASGAQDGSVRLFDLASNDPNAGAQALGDDPDHPVTGLAFSPDGHWLAAASGFTLRLWDMTRPGADPRLYATHKDRLTSLAFSPDGHWLATGSQDKTAQLWKLSAGGPSGDPLVLAGHEDWVNVLAFSPGSRWLVTGSRDHNIRLWDLSASNPAAKSIELRGHEDAVISLAFSPDGNWLASGSGSGDHTARLWNLGAPDPAADSVVLRGHGESVNAVAFSPDGNWLATASGDHTARLWLVRLDALQAQACQDAGRNLTRKEWAQYFPNQAYETTCPQWPAIP